MKPHKHLVEINNFEIFEEVVHNFVKSDDDIHNLVKFDFLFP